MKQIHAVLTGRGPVVVGQLTFVADAARLMTECQIGAVPVVDGDRLVGIFSERDVMARVVATGREPAQTLVRDVMTTSIMMASPEESHAECLRRMQQACIRHLPVVCDGRLVGIVSLRDLLAVELDERDEALNLLNAYVHDVPVDLRRNPSG